jgi:hypothetical protein
LFHEDHRGRQKIRGKEEIRETAALEKRLKAKEFAEIGAEVYAKV